MLKFCAKVPDEKPVEIALEELYSSDEVTEIPRPAMKNLLRLAVTNVHLKCCKIRYTQWEGLAMGALLAVILANLWMKPFENHCSNQKREGGTKLR